MATSSTLMLHLTGRCNLKCRHCYMEGSPTRRERLPFDWIADALRSAPMMGIRTVFLTGGEPLMYPRFAAVARLAAAVEGLQTTVCTNATLLRERDVALLAELGVGVHVSIDGKEEFHDSFRAVEGAFEKARRGIAELVAAGVPVTVTTTVCRKNVAGFPLLAEWVLEQGVRRLLVQPLLALGRAVDIREERLTSAELLTLIMQTSDLANRPGTRLKLSIIGGNKQFFLVHPCAAYVCNGGGCHRGVSAEVKKVVVREDGWILPEATNLDRRYAIGHVDEGPLTELVSRFFAEGYEAFDRLARVTYHELVPDWPDPILPWDELLALRSRSPMPSSTNFGEPACGRGGHALALRHAPA